MAARLRPLVDHEHPRAGPPRGMGRREPLGPAPTTSTSQCAYDLS